MMTDFGTVEVDYETDAFHETGLQETQLSGDEKSVFGDFVGDIQQLAKDHIKRWFADKEMACGGPIPDRMLYTARHLTQVLNTDICDGVDVAYNAICESEEMEMKAFYEGGVSEDVEVVLWFMHQTSSMGVPKVFQGGLLLMHLDICLGIDV